MPEPSSRVKKGSGVELSSRDAVCACPRVLTTDNKDELIMADLERVEAVEGRRIRQEPMSASWLRTASTTPSEWPTLTSTSPARRLKGCQPSRQQKGANRLAGGKVEVNFPGGSFGLNGLGGACE